MTVRPWWMGRPMVWAWVVGIALACCVTPSPAQVAPLSVTLHTEAPCPAPGERTPLLRLPTGCPSPWAGILYTPDEHSRTRAEGAQVNELAKARGARADEAEARLLTCRTQRDELAAACVMGVARVEGAVEALSDLAAPPEPVRGWVYSLAGGLTAAAGSLAGLAGKTSGEVQLYGIAGAAGGAVVGTAAVWLVQWASQ